mmetsp:Transcript_22050/g.61764  ORF Transcript_22050/g.61764 Transcript_22050/m.61764 type:complete len:290 (+) Transcript_22050:145-1014(+)
MSTEEHGVVPPHKARAELQLQVVKGGIRSRDDDQPRAGYIKPVQEAALVLDVVQDNVSTRRDKRLRIVRQLTCWTDCVVLIDLPIGRFLDDHAVPKIDEHARVIQVASRASGPNCSEGLQAPQRWRRHVEAPSRLQQRRPNSWQHIQVSVPEPDDAEGPHGSHNAHHVERSGYSGAALRRDAIQACDQLASDCAEQCRLRIGERSGRPRKGRQRCEAHFPEFRKEVPPACTHCFEFNDAELSVGPSVMRQRLPPESQPRVAQQSERVLPWLAPTSADRRVRVALLTRAH